MTDRLRKQPASIPWWRAPSFSFTSNSDAVTNVNDVIYTPDEESVSYDAPSVTRKVSSLSRLSDPGSGNAAPTFVFPKDASECRTCALSHDGTVALIGHADGRVTVYQTLEGTQSEFTQHARDKAVRQVALSADGRIGASAGIDGTVRIFDTSTCVQTSMLRQTGFQWATGAALSADGCALIASFTPRKSEHGRIVRFDWREEAISILWQGYRRAFEVRCSRDASSVAFIRQGGSIVALDAEPGTAPVQRCTFDYMKGDFDFAIDSAGARVLIADRTLQLHTLHGAARVVDSFGGYRPSSVRRCSICADGSRIIDVGKRVVTVRDVASGKVELRLVHRSKLTSCAISADGMTIVATDCYGSLVVWRPFELPRPPSRHSIATSCAAGADRVHRVVSVPGVSFAPVGTGCSGIAEKLVDRGSAIPLTRLKPVRRPDATALSIESISSFGTLGARGIGGAVVEVESAVEFESEVEIVDFPPVSDYVALEPEMASARLMYGGRGRRDLYTS